MQKEREPDADTPADETGTATLFAQSATDPVGIITRLRKDVAGDQRLLARVPAAEVERAIDRAVYTLWDQSRVKVFVPVLALRDVREALTAVDGLTATLRPQGRQAD